VLTAGRIDGHPLVQKGAISGIPCFRAGGEAEGHLVFDTIRRFKGLDRPIVLLIDVEELDGPELIYVGLTRPSVMMMVFGATAALEKLRKGSIDEVD
jgi:superfamily I DNA and RNA helicase